jgi:hypothetical protein
VRQLFLCWLALCTALRCVYCRIVVRVNCVSKPGKALHCADVPGAVKFLVVLLLWSVRFDRGQQLPWVFAVVGTAVAAVSAARCVLSGMWLRGSCCSKRDSWQLDSWFKQQEKVWEGMSEGFSERVAVVLVRPALCICWRKPGCCVCCATFVGRARVYVRLFAVLDICVSIMVVFLGGMASQT